MTIFQDFDTYTNGTGTGIADVFKYVNYLTNDFLGIGILLAVGLVSFISTKNYSWDRSFAFTSFVIVIVGIFLRFLNLIGDLMLTFCGILLAISLIILIIERDTEGLG